jgi:hypothetical protein
VGHILTFVIENLWGTKNKKKIYFKRHENRSGPKTKAAIPATKYDHLTFKFFFQKLLGTFKNFNFNIKKNAFKSQVDLEIKIYQKVFSKYFPKFNIPYSFFFKTKAKKEADKKARNNTGNHNVLNDKSVKINKQKHVKKRKKLLKYSLFFII